MVVKSTLPWSSRTLKAIALIRRVYPCYSPGLQTHAFLSLLALPRQTLLPPQKCVWAQAQTKLQIQENGLPAQIKGRRAGRWSACNLIADQLQRIKKARLGLLTVHADLERSLPAGS